MAINLVETITSCVKYSLFAFNFLFVITGVIIISVGAGVSAKYQLYAPFLDAPYTSVPALLIATGVIIFIVAFFGCCGAIKENYCMILTFAVMLILVFILELAAGISGYVLRDSTEAKLKVNLQQSLVNYNVKPEFTNLWDDLQSNLKCCGVDKPESWPEKNQFPLSCCNIPSGTVKTFECILSNETYNIGCVDKVVNYVESHAGSLGAAGICLAIIQLVGIVCACYLAKRSKNEYIS